MLKRRKQRASGDEAGFSLVELLVGMTIMMLVVGALLSAMESLTRAERTTSTRIDDEQAARLTLARFTHDVHGVASVLPQATLTDYASTVDLLLTDGTHVQWAYSASAHTVIRYLVAGDGSRQTTAMLPNLVNSVSQPVFAWGGAVTNDLLSAAWATTADVAHCATTIGATVAVSSRAGLAPQTETVRAAAPNQTPQGCGP